MSTSNRKLIVTQLKQETNAALAHGGVLPAMWLDRGYIVRVQSWLGDRWGGGHWWEVVSLTFDPLRSKLEPSMGRMFGYVTIALRAERYHVEETHEVMRAQHDLIELIRPHIATPTQWRLRS